MKLTFILLLTAMLSVSANGVSQIISFSGKNVPLDKVFKVVEQQSGYVIVFKEATLLKAKSVTASVTNVPLKDFLDLIFKNQSLQYSIINRNIVVLPKAAPPEEASPAPSENAMVAEGLTLYVMNGTERLRGATVINVSSKKSYITDVNGLVFVNVNAGDKLKVSYIGFQDYLLAVTSEILQQKFVSVDLTVSESKLDEVQISVKGRTNRRTGVSNIQTMKAEEIAKVPATNILDILQGQIAGLQIQSTTNSSSPRKVELRGRNILDNGAHAEPLYVIDGLPIATIATNPLAGLGQSMVDLNVGYSNGGGVKYHPLFSINPKDIESVDVLKDADALALFGSMGANGAILITTKKGKPGPLKMDVSYNKNFNFVQRYQNYLNTAEYLAMRREALMNDNLKYTDANAYDLLKYDANAYTDWQKFSYKPESSDEISMSFGGGDVKSTYRMNISYLKSKEMFNLGRGNDRLNAGFNYKHSSANNKTTIQANSTITLIKINTFNVANLSDLPPNSPGVYDENGNYNFLPYRREYQSDYPFTYLGEFSEGQDLISRTNLAVNYEILKGLTWNNDFSIEFGANRNGMYYSTTAVDKYFFAMNRAITGANNSLNYQGRSQLSYIKHIRKHSLNAMSSINYLYSKQFAATNLGYMYPSDKLIKHYPSAGIKYMTEAETEFKSISYRANISYDYDNIYGVSLNLNYDGTSRFGKNTRFGTFGSVGAFWNVSNYDFFKNWSQTAISFLKFRGTWGVTGNANIGEYQWLSRWAKAEGGDWTYGNNPDYSIIQPVNQNYRWSKSTKKEVGFDMGLLMDRLVVGFSAYQNSDGDQLAQIPTPYYTGFSSAYGNSPAVIRNEGFELSFNGTLYKSKDISINMNFFIARNKNYLYKYPGIDDSPYKGIYKIGQSLNFKYVTRFIGIDPLTGFAAYEDYNKDGMFTSVNTVSSLESGLDDRYKMINLDPKYNGGFGFNANYKNALNIRLAFSFVNTLVPNYLSSVLYGSANNVVFVDDVVSNRWRQPGDHALYPKFTTDFGAVAAMGGALDEAYINGSYLSLDNVSVMYTLPAKWVSKVRLKNADLFVNGRKLFKISRHPLRDSEMQTSVPQIVTIQTGINLSF